jgi:hypothetical protein
MISSEFPPIQFSWHWLPRVSISLQQGRGLTPFNCPHTTHQSQVPGSQGYPCLCLTWLWGCFYNLPPAHFSLNSLQNSRKCSGRASRRRDTGVGAEGEATAYRPFQCSMCSPTRKLSKPHYLGVLWEASLHRHDWLTHWPFMVGPDLCPQLLHGLWQEKELQASDQGWLSSWQPALSLRLTRNLPEWPPILLMTQEIPWVAMLQEWGTKTTCISVISQPSVTC